MTTSPISGREPSRMSDEEPRHDDELGRDELEPREPMTENEYTDGSAVGAEPAHESARDHEFAAERERAVVGEPEDGAGLTRTESATSATDQPGTTSGTQGAAPVGAQTDVPGVPAAEAEYGGATGRHDGHGTGYETGVAGGYGTGTTGTSNGTTTGTTGGAAAGNLHGDPKNGARDGVVIAPDQNTDFRSRWREIQAEFIDDPQLAAKDADHLVSEITRAFAAQAEERRTRLASSWQHDGTHGTEELRLVMRQYRGLVDHMLDQ